MLYIFAFGEQEISLTLLLNKIILNTLQLLNIFYHLYENGLKNIFKPDDIYHFLKVSRTYTD